MTVDLWEDVGRHRRNRIGRERQKRREFASRHRGSRNNTREEFRMKSTSKLRLLTTAGVTFVAVLALNVSAWAAGPEVVAGPAADPKCYVPWTEKTKFFKYPAKPGPYRIA